MAYEKIEKPQGHLFHYTGRDKLDAILRDERIRKFQDMECWFCTSLEDTIRLMEMTVMKEGGLYIDANGFPKRYPKFVPKDYVILELTPRHQNGDWVKWNQEMPKDTPQEVVELAKEFSELKKGFRGNLRFYPEVTVHEVAELLQQEEPVMTLQ